MTGSFQHNYAFDPAYGHSLQSLLALQAPQPTDGFAAFWRERYQRAMQVHPRPVIRHTGVCEAGFEVYDLSYQSTDAFKISGWLLLPQGAAVRRGIVMGHGYGGREAPDFWYRCIDTALLFPCFRGLSRSRKAPISSEPYFHVLHDIHLRDKYILGGCVDDLWLAVSAMQRLFPASEGHIGYCGASFGGGIGAMALPWDERIQRAHFGVPTFGNHPQRLALHTVGSGEAVRRYQQKHGNVLETLRYYDAASAAAFVQQPVHVAAALFDPVVAPPGQFSVYNALPQPKSLFLLDAGHFDYPQRIQQEMALQRELEGFFAAL